MSMQLDLLIIILLLIYLLFRREAESKPKTGPELKENDTP
jgi:hypothetical protein